MSQLGKALFLLVATVTATVEAGKPEPEFRTRIPEITPARWAAKPQPLARPGKVSRDNYLEFIKRTYQRSRGPALRTAGGAENPYQCAHARSEAFFSLVEKDPAGAQTAMKFVRGDYAYRTQGKGAQKQTGFALFLQAVEVCRWLRANPALTVQDRDFLTRWLLLIEEKHGPFEYGAMNRSVGSAVGRDYLAMLLPDDGKTPERRHYAEAVWNDWWPQRDTDENSSGYNGLWLHEIGLWLEITGKEQRYQDPGMKQLAERSLAQVTPLGVVPGFGDVVSWCSDPGQWIGLMEKWASVYRDGRFKWAAHRLFEYTLAHEKEMWQWGNINDSTAEGLMDAWLAADDSIAEKEPELGSLVTYRKAARWTSREERKTGRWFELLDETIPNKLILRTGWQPEDTYALVELCPPMGHGQGDAGSINYLLSQGSVLLADTPYLIKAHTFHNCFVVEPDSVPAGARPRWRGGDFADMKIEVDDLHTAPKAAYARVHVHLLPRRQRPLGARYGDGRESLCCAPRPGLADGCRLRPARRALGEHLLDHGACALHLGPALHDAVGKPSVGSVAVLCATGGHRSGYRRRHARRYSGHRRPAADEYGCTAGAVSARGHPEGGPISAFHHRSGFSSANARCVRVSEGNRVGLGYRRCRRAQAG